MKLTPIFIFATIAAIGIYDVYIIITQGKQEAISAYIIRWSYEYPSFTFLFGFTMGHLFWRMESLSIWKKDDKDKR